MSFQRIVCSARKLSAFLVHRSASVMTSEPNAKRLATDKMKIGTHDGTFHCDEVVACFLLKQLPQYKNAEIVRTRNQSILDECDIVVDVGRVFDPKNHRYDHHQKGFTETMNSLLPDKPWVTKLSSAGLVYCHFGHEIIGAITKRDVKDPLVKNLFDKLYEGFIEEVDGVDNGINPCDNPRYTISTGLSRRVSFLNPNWNSEDQNTDKIFPEAMELVGREFLERLNFYVDVWWPARELVAKALDNRFSVHKSGSILEFPSGGIPWKEHLYNLEEEQGIAEAIKFVLFTDQKGDWRVQAVNKSRNDFGLRLGLLEKWRGLDGNEEIWREVPGFIFTHMAGFIGGNKTRDGAFTMAVKSLESEGTV